MAPPPTSEQKIVEAKKVAKSEPGKAENLYREVLEKSPGSNEAALRDYENALVGLGELFRDFKRQEDLAQLVKASRSALSSFAKAKTAKLGTCNRQQTRTNLLTCCSPTITRPLYRHSKLSRSSDQYHKVMYRMGEFAETILPAPKPRDKIGGVVYAKAVLL
jgi:26S proteasome regulatory subunit RPN6 N-terminal domain